MPRTDETWHRLRTWTSGSAASERLAAQVLRAEGYEDVDPAHPLGGPDRGQDALAHRNGHRWVMAVYFPRGEQDFKAIATKAATDYLGVARNGAHGMVFITNQELTLAARHDLRESAPGPLEIYHLERVASILDDPSMASVREQFLDIPAAGSSTRHLEDLLTGGDTFCYAMLYHFDLKAQVARNFVVTRVGDFPLFDVRIRIRDLDLERDILQEHWGEINSPASFNIVEWPLRDHVYYRLFFAARNGAWHQDLDLRRSASANCWLATTRVLGRNGRDVIFEHEDQGFVTEFGSPVSRP